MAWAPSLYVQKAGPLLCSHMQLPTSEPRLGTMENWNGCTRGRSCEGGSKGKLGAEDVERQQAGKHLTCSPGTKVMDLLSKGQDEEARGGQVGKSPGRGRALSGKR